MAIGVTGTVVGVVLGSALHRALVIAARDLTSIPFAYSVVPGATVVAAFVALVATLAGAMFAARHATTKDISHALAYE